MNINDPRGRVKFAPVRLNLERAVVLDDLHDVDAVHGIGTKSRDPAEEDLRAGVPRRRAQDLEGDRRLRTLTTLEGRKGGERHAIKLKQLGQQVIGLFEESQALQERRSRS